MSTFKKNLMLICIAVLGWIIVFNLVAEFYDAANSWSLMLIGASIITFFALLALPGNLATDGTIKESRIRFSIAGSLIVLYLVYFGSVVYLDYEMTDEKEKITETFAVNIMPTLSNLLMVTISFYFGSTAAIDIAGRFSKKDQTGQ